MPKLPSSFLSTALLTAAGLLPLATLSNAEPQDGHHGTPARNAISRDGGVGGTGAAGQAGNGGSSGGWDHPAATAGTGPAGGGGGNGATAGTGNGGGGNGAVGSGSGVSGGGGGGVGSGGGGGAGSALEESAGGSGGGGGALNYSSTFSVTLNSFHGGMGGHGGAADYDEGEQRTSKGGGGGGGGGGTAARLSGSQNSVGNGHTVQGGHGGNGGFAAYGGHGGGGAGGHGIEKTAGTITNRGTILGGTGGNAGGVGAQAGAGGVGIVLTDAKIDNRYLVKGGDAGKEGGLANRTGNAAIQGHNATVINHGSISGGNASASGTQAEAIRFTGGSNTLEMHNGSGITGAVIGAGNDLLVHNLTIGERWDAAQYGGQYTGFNRFEKKGAGTLTLHGTTSLQNTNLSWTVTGGTLTVEHRSAIGTGNIVVDGASDSNARFHLTQIPGETRPQISNQIILNNAGTFTNDANLVYDAQRLGTFAIVGNETGTGRVTNRGTISTTYAQAAIRLNHGGSVTNYHLIHGKRHGLYFAGNSSSNAAVTNHSGARIEGGVHLWSAGTFAITNQGSIKQMETQAGLSLEDSAAIYISSATGTLTNQGTLESTRDTVNAGAGITLDNSGGTALIKGGQAIVIREVGAHTSTIHNREGAHIEGTTAAIIAAGGTTLTNAGSILGNVALNQTGGGARYLNHVTLLHTGTLSGNLAIGSHADSVLELSGTGHQSYSVAVTGSTTFTNGTLHKSGTGAWTLDRALSQSATEITEGTLRLTTQLGGTSARIYEGGTLELVNNTGSIASSVHLTNHGTLRGEGQILAAEVLHHGTLRPSGTQAAQLAFQNALTLGGDSRTELALALFGPGDANTSIAAPSLTYGGALTITISGELAQVEETAWRFFHTSAAPSGQWTSITLAGSYDLSLLRVGDDWQGSNGETLWSFNHAQGVLSVEAIPEPSTILLLGLAGAGLLAAARRRQRRG